MDSALAAFALRRIWAPYLLPPISGITYHKAPPLSKVFFELLYSNGLDVREPLSELMFSSYSDILFPEYHLAGDFGDPTTTFYTESTTTSFPVPIGETAILIDDEAYIPSITSPAAHALSAGPAYLDNSSLSNSAQIASKGNDTSAVAVPRQKYFGITWRLLTSQAFQEDKPWSEIGCRTQSVWTCWPPQVQTLSPLASAGKIYIQLID